MWYGETNTANNCDADALSEDKKGFWEDVSEWYQEAEPPQGFQGTVLF